METILLIITTILTALLAGIFLAYALSVNGALHSLGDREYIRAMQYINIVIQNGLFFLTFMGPVALLPIVAYMYHDAADPRQFYLLIGASVVYIAGSFILTIVGNVPYNERLARVDVNDSSDAELKSAREKYEAPWNTMHLVRTVASVVAAILLVAVCAL